MHCLRYRVRADLDNDSAAAWLAEEITDCERNRLNSVDQGPAAGRELEVADHPVLSGLSQCSVWTENRQAVGVIFHRYWVGIELTINEAGTHSLPGDDMQEDLIYEYQIKPLAQLRGVRLTSVWGQDGKPGPTAAREDSATRALIRTLLAQAEKQLPMGGTSLPMVEVRSIKIGELEQAPVYGFTVLGSSGSLVMRINSAESLLKDQDLELITLDDYRDRLVNLKLAGNQQVDTQEALTSGRKFMLWNIPRALNNTDLAIVAQEFFGDTFVESEVTTSAQCHPYGWFVLNAATNELQQQAADFEAVLQAKWGVEITLAMSKTRQQRIRMNATGRERMEQRDSLNKPAGVLKEIMIPAKVIQDAVMESAFLDLWVDQVYTRLAA